MRVVDGERAPVDEERHRIVRNEAVVGKDEGEWFDVGADDRHGFDLHEENFWWMKPRRAAHVPFVSLGISKTRQVVVAWAKSRPLASVMRTSAVAARRATLSVRPAVRAMPLSLLMPLMKETLNSSVVYPVAAGSMLLIASPIAGSKRVAA